MWTTSQWDQVPPTWALSRLWPPGPQEVAKGPQSWCPGGVSSGNEASKVWNSPPVMGHQPPTLRHRKAQSCWPAVEVLSLAL